MKAKIIDKTTISVTHNFKLSMVTFIFFLTIFHLADILYLPTFDPHINLVSDKIMLVIVLFIILYIWVQEKKDYHTLLKLYKNLGISQEQLKQAEVESISALINAEESKDPFTYGHSDRVTKIAIAIAEEMNLGDDFKNTLSRAGLLHDIGKIAISNTILWKEEKLTEAEWEIIKSHSRKGVEILEPLKFLTLESQIIIHHHEHYDGTGYPVGLKDGEIPLGSLILSVADAFDAMNSDRPYRKALEKDVIIDELKRGRGGQHKPEITDIFLRLIEKKPELWNR